MSWLTALKLVLDLNSAYDEVDKVRKYSKKLEKADPKNLSWDDLKFFSNKTMDKARKAIKETLKKARKAEKAALEWPESLSARAFDIYAKEFQKSGKDSQKTRNALKTYQLALKAFDQDLNRLLASLKAMDKKIAKRQQKADALVKYADLLEQAFMTCAKIPSLTGTAQNAMFFGLSQDAMMFGSTAGDVSASIQRLAKRNAGFIREVNDRIKANRLWMTWANGEKIAQESNLKKNSTAKTPK